MSERIDFEIVAYDGEGTSSRGRLTSDRDATTSELSRCFGIAVIQALYALVEKMGLEVAAVYGLVRPLPELVPQTVVVEAAGFEELAAKNAELFDRLIAAEVVSAQVEAELARLRAALRQIADEDYRGPRPASAVIAARALKEGEPS